nr:MAG TPA: IrrE protein [Caudoviricetes sp.]
MDNVIYITFPNNRQKMDSLEEELRSMIDIKKNKNKPERVAQIIRKWYANYSDDLYFPVIELAQKMDIEVMNADFPNHKTDDRRNSDETTLKGYLGLYPTEDNRKPRIVVSNAESYGHQRWTVAHELWHYFTHANDIRKEKNFYPENSNNYELNDDSEEACANKFATELLMPARLFKIVYDETAGKNIFSKGKDIEKLAEAFMVSNEAAKRRIDNLKKQGII